MQTIDMDRLLREESAITASFGGRTPFKYVVIDDFLRRDEALKIFLEYPAIDKTWQSGAGLHTRGKWGQPVLAGTVAERFYKEVNSPAFLDYLGRVTGIPKLLEDPDLSGAGLHQIIDGGFLNVHVDYNRLGALHRRLNLIVYANPEWTESYGGYLELWDMQRKVRVGNIAPLLNRCVIFETNEVSFHGHPVPLNTGGRTTRKSLSIYYYTAEREAVAPEHNTVYVNTSGARGAVRLLLNGVAHAGRKLARAVRL